MQNFQPYNSHLFFRTIEISFLFSFTSFECMDISQNSQKSLAYRLIFSYLQRWWITAISSYLNGRTSNGSLPGFKLKNLSHRLICLSVRPKFSFLTDTLFSATKQTDVHFFVRPNWNSNGWTNFLFKINSHFFRKMFFRTMKFLSDCSKQICWRPKNGFNFVFSSD